MVCNNDKLIGVISNIQRYSLHDGPGIRTIIFFKGCPLACRWCCNPETQQKEKEIMFYSNRCIGCGKCVEVCPEKIELNELFDSKRCKKCGKCVEVCPTGARTLIERQVKVNELFEEIIKDEPFFRHSGGGVTLGGGEPCLQVSFARALIEKCEQRGINVAVETSGYCSEDKFFRLIELAHHIFIDIKHMDSKKHKTFTGVTNELILKNIQCAAKIDNVNLTIRVPVIPGFNDTPNELEDIAKFVSALDSKISVELLPFHKFSANKYQALGRVYCYQNTIPPNENKMRFFRSIFKRQGVNIYNPKNIE
jgi:pyruvate formate lyase activating enzyme